MKQCKKCPWLVSVDPHDIPNGYCETRHAELEKTIARDNVFSRSLNMMACHESPNGSEHACVGWLSNQLGAGNNIGLRMWAIKNLKGQTLDLIGEQHETFEDTLPKEPTHDQ